MHFYSDEQYDPLFTHGCMETICSKVEIPVMTTESVLMPEDEPILPGNHYLDPGDAARLSEEHDKED